MATSSVATSPSFNWQKTEAAEDAEKRGFWQTGWRQRERGRGCFRPANAGNPFALIHPQADPS